MCFLVKDILEQNLFPGARLAAGKAGLTAEISWVNVMEILDSPDTVQPGELLVTTGFGLDDSHRFGDLIAHLKARGVGGLAIQLYYLDHIPAYILESAERYGFAVLEFPKQLTFSEILHVLFRRLNAGAPENSLSDEMHRAALSFFGRTLTAERTAFFPEAGGQTVHLLLVESVNYLPANSEIWNDCLIQLRSLLTADAAACRTERLPGGHAAVLAAYPSAFASQLRFYTLSVKLTRLSEQFGANFYIGIEQLRTPEQLPQAFRHAAASIDVLRTIKARRGVCMYAHTTFVKMFGVLHQNDRSIVLENQALQVLLDYDRLKQTAYVHTLRVYLAVGCNVTHAATSLFIHRHTLLKRLDKITELTHLDLDDYYTRIYMSIALLFHDYFAF